MLRAMMVAALLLHGATGAAQASIQVESVMEGGAAEAAGLQPGDRLLRVDGKVLASFDELRAIVAARKPGDTVTLGLERKGEEVELELTFGQREGGGASLGVRLQVSEMPTGGDSEEGTEQCLAWVEETYRIESMIRELDLAIAEDYEAIRECVGMDARRMGTANAVKYCDNIFKVHCSGLDLLTEIGEAQVDRCKDVLAGSMGLQPGQHRAWRTCAEGRLFDGYSMEGKVMDEHACRAAFLEECGTNIDAAVKAGSLSGEQRAFVACCSSGHSDDCEMIDDGFERGPCREHGVCVNRHSSEWLHCSVLP